ncbi:MAG TPA: TatD family hydrolase [Anaerolineae bacterium]|nr:TatD family hydrolase [Anaerolineae bacterium]
MNVDLAHLADTHCHLTLSTFDQDRQQILTRAKEAGVSHLLVPGVDLPSSRRAVELSQQYSEVYAAVGIHPHNAKTWNQSTKEEIKELARSPKVVAVGEIGLDYYRNLSPPELQRVAFQGQLDLALELELPVVIHNRDAVEDLMGFLETWSKKLPPTLISRAGVLHANYADLEVAQKAIEVGFYIGVAGPITYRNADALRRVTAQLPLDRVLLETDAPYLTPHPKRGKRNEPAYIQLVAQQSANLFQVSMNTIAATTTQNATELFNWNHGNDNNDIL